MAEAESKVPVRQSKDTAPALFDWHPFETLRRQIDRLFEDAPFPRNAPSELEPFGRFSLGWASTPAVDLIEKDKEYQVTAELPGLDEKNVEVKLQNGSLVISGEKKEEREEKDKDKGYFLSERRFGSFRRAFRLPEDVDKEKIAATFAKGVLTVRLPKSATAQKPEKVISVKAA
ncbi:MULTISPECIES: Hsp20/alpha crystallin family protein [Methylosinus]|uniref:Hsp20/alpha crystallin family protein n=1 Tax=Methylosinus trichosporium (strain ATCC 35070 / NCIMB 11131 / UNIQEM 75 / OB3b) TaxID=595536 RepID=A0A2D2D109_METT3|nr:MULTISPECIES: Hsp20/alpha crystallin family protein [Methylosinus]ATQ68678.1 Hsp20/alpha crystallin family protein [Methylosinus trichosporium OB3b]OBS53159.1 molecular chaperone Hsp20 [Methylosinus sp. 3S-1]